MPTMTITKEIQFDAGHRIPNHESKCSSPHGHRYRVVVTVGGRLQEVSGASDEGMVMDFGFIKDLLMQFVHDVFDHGFIVFNEDTLLLQAFDIQTEQDEEGAWAIHEGFPMWKIVVVPFIPTAENLASHIYEVLRPHIGKSRAHAFLEDVTVWETPTSSACCSKFR